MMAIFKKLLAKPRLANLVPKITHDTRAAYADIDINGPVDPFAVMNKLIFQITIRAIAADEFVEDKALFDKTMNYYSYITKASGLDVMFPHLPTIRKLVQMAGATKLFMIVTGIIHKRRKAGESVDDSLQVMIDAGLSDHDICLVRSLSHAVHLQKLTSSSLSSVVLSLVSSTHPSLLVGFPHSSTRTQSGRPESRPKSTVSWKSIAKALQKHQ